MAIKDIVKVNRKTFFDPRGWLGYDTLKQQTSTVAGLFNTVFRPEAPPVGPAETFEEVIKRLKLSKADLTAMQKRYFSLAILFFSLGVACVLISLYFLFTGSFFSFLITLSLTVYLTAQAFRNHFLYFQIKHHKLGVTLEEWRQNKVKR